MFISYISLGYFCGTAGSLMKNGYRAFKGPFDWCFSDFEPVIELMHNDFAGFMQKDNLESVEGRPLEFFDKKYKILFNHDVKNNFELEFEEIKTKYEKRVRKFIEASKTSTCFVRAIRNQEEISYISKNEEYILQAVKKHNKVNDIIFVAPTFVDYSALKNTSFKYFELDVKEYARENFQVLLDVLDTVPEALEFLKNNYPPILRVQNLSFNDIRDEMKSFYKNMYSAFEYRYDTAVRMLNTDFDKIKLPYDVVIYGVGKLGQALYKQIQSNCKIKCFVESKPKISSWNDIKVYCIDELSSITCKNYIVTPLHDFDNIKNNILTKVPDAKVISLNDILLD